MARTLNYEAVWGDMVALLRQHREAIVAIAGLLIFVPNWITGFVVGPPDLEGAQSITDMFAAQGELIQANWHIMLPLGLLSLFGGASVLTIMLRSELNRIGDAMTFAAKLYPAYLLLTILTAIRPSVS